MRAPMRKLRPLTSGSTRTTSTRACSGGTTDFSGRMRTSSLLPGS